MTWWKSVHTHDFIIEKCPWWYRYHENMPGSTVDSIIEIYPDKYVDVCLNVKTKKKIENLHKRALWRSCNLWEWVFKKIDWQFKKIWTDWNAIDF